MHASSSSRNDNGRVRISADVIDTISLMTTRQVPGVEDIVGFASGRIRDHRPFAESTARPGRRARPDRSSRWPRYFSTRDRIRPSLYLRITADPAAPLDALVDTVKTHVRQAVHASTGLRLDRVRVTVVDRTTAQRQCDLRRRNVPGRAGADLYRGDPVGDGAVGDERLTDEAIADLLLGEAAATPGVASVIGLELLPTADTWTAMLRLYVTLGDAVPRVVRRLRKRLDTSLRRYDSPPLAALHVDVVGIRISSGVS